MAETTNISWCDSTMNPWIGCTKVSPACDFCYASVSTATRALRVQWGAGNSRHRTSDSTWKQPLAWERQHAKFFAEHGSMRRVFCASLADVFDNEVDPEWRSDLFTLIKSTPHLIWMLLTKRIGNAKAMLPPDWDIGVVGGKRYRGYPNVMLGATIANQAELERDIYKLIDTPAHSYFISYEPALGALDFTGMWVHYANPAMHENVLERIDLVIAGGESGLHARPAEIDWFRSLKLQCAAVGTPFFMKQLGGVRDKRGRLEDLPEDLRVREFPTTAVQR